MDSENGALLLNVICGRNARDVTFAELDSLLSLASAHGLIGHVHEALAREQRSHSEWQALFEAQCINARVQMQSAAEIGAALKEAAIPCVFAKGVAFTATIYDTPGVRPFNDQDLLIRPEDLRKTDEILRRLGFVLSADRSHPFEVSYRRERLPGYPVSLDLHWDFASPDALQAAERIPVAEILSRAQWVGAIPVPAPEDSLLLATANLIRKSAEPVMLIADYARLSKLNIDWSQVAARARAWGLSSGVWLGVKLAAEMFGTAMPTEITALEPSSWRREWLLKHTRGERIWQSNRQSTFRYRIVFKLMCLNSFGEVLTVAAAMPRAVLRKAGFSRSLSADLPK